MNKYPEQGQAEIIHRGLACMPANFVARLCPVCKGSGRYEQMFTAGCGGGYYRSNSYCDYCEGEGLLVVDKPAPMSVVNQVRVAAERAAA